jgi:threonine/homoserine/homoserine lactone efflux protein
MEWGLFIKGFVIGFSIAAPEGPIGILCIQRTLSGVYVRGLVTFLVDQSSRIRIIGGVFLCYLGIRAFLRKPQQRTVSVANSTILSAYGTTFFLTLTNPMRILFFAGIFAGLGIVSESIHYASAGLMVIGVFSGSGAWWLLLSGATGIFRNRISEGKLAPVNKIYGVVILAFGVVALQGTFFNSRFLDRYSRRYLSYVNSYN